jgi:hypothetical protein
MALLSDILTWWSRTRVPTVEQRQATFNSFRHKSTPIAISEVTGLQDALNSRVSSDNFNILKPIVLAPGTGSWEVPAGTLIRSICVIDDSDLTFSIGLTEAGKDYVEDADISQGSEILEVQKYFRVATTLYFTGIKDNTIIRITTG